MIINTKWQAKIYLAAILQKLFQENTKKSALLAFFLFYVGVARFELAASWSQTRRDTGLRYTPKLF